MNTIVQYVAFSNFVIHTGFGPFCRVLCGFIRGPGSLVSLSSRLLHKEAFFWGTHHCTTGPAAIKAPDYNLCHKHPEDDPGSSQMSRWLRCQFIHTLQVLGVLRLEPSRGPCPSGLVSSGLMLMMLMLMLMSPLSDFSSQWAAAGGAGMQRTAQQCNTVYNAIQFTM